MVTELEYYPKLKVKKGFLSVGRRTWDKWRKGGEKK